MSQSMTKKGQSIAYRALAFQFALVVLASIIALFWGLKISLSIFAGGMISIIPSLLFVYIVFQHSGAQQSRKVLHGFYKGEAIKILLAVVLFVVVLKTLPVSAAASLIGFMVAVTGQMIAPFLVKTT
ncbi:ATP synthase subunit I [Pleionea sediminis]|uniref:ATP synthase subunit I n=1 Tax=Pleionea sediminis TaxID=2569479 RepID=UPI0011857345|nr:ATP synthase subunit I [Pleionea sediminis]